MSLINSITPSQIQNLTTTQIRDLSTADVKLLSTAQIAAMSSEQIAAIETRDLLVLVPRTNPARFALDDSVWCSWSAEDVYLFSARQASVVMASPSGSV